MSHTQESAPKGGASYTCLIHRRGGRGGGVGGATFEKYDAKAAVVSKGILMVRSKMPKCERVCDCRVCASVC